MSYIDDEELKIDISNDEEDDDEKGLDGDLNEPVDDDLLEEDDDLLVSEFAGLDGSLY